MVDVKQLTNIRDLRAAPYNPRIIDDSARSGLRYSLEEFGDISGITWNARTGNLVCGHQRVDVLRGAGGELVGDAIELGGERFKVRTVDWPIEKEEVANIAANNQEIAGRWKPDVSDIIKRIRDRDDEAFESLKLKELMRSAPKAPVVVDDDEVPEPPKEPVTKLGDVWTLGRHTVVCGDACAGSTYCVSGASMIFTDPPYGVDYTGGAKKRTRLQGDSPGTDVYALALPLMASVCDRAAALYLWYADGHTAAAAAAAAGYQITAQIIWAKNHAQFVTAAHYKGKHEPCHYGHKKGSQARWYGPNNEVTLWEYPRASRNDYHPTQKPVPIAMRAITNSTATGDTVVDGFLGSGTTLIAAEQLDRTCYGVEIEPKYVDVIVERWENLTGGKATRGERS